MLSWMAAGGSSRPSVSPEVRCAVRRTSAWLERDITHSSAHAQQQGIFAAQNLIQAPRPARRGTGPGQRQQEEEPAGAPC
jgi:hypothetical protein